MEPNIIVSSDVTDGNTDNSITEHEEAADNATEKTGSSELEHSGSSEDYDSVGFVKIPERIDEEDENVDADIVDGIDMKDTSAALLDMTDGAMALKRELDKITVAAPEWTIKPDTDYDMAEFPESYKGNVPKEKLVLAYAENFRRQYVHLYRDRKPLFLNPVNECGTEKFVCNTIRPSQMEFKELYNWDGAAEFVADYLNPVLIEPAHELPLRLLSPTTVMSHQKGNCFEYSNLLVSFLIAAGYDAYVISGYAIRETCYMDETREICPLLKPKVQSEEKKDGSTCQKYGVKPPKDLRSKFILKMEARNEKALADEETAKIAEEEAKQLELEKPPEDPLHGLRIHSWVLVLAGKREVAESFFIEPFTGLPEPLDTDKYLGIESLWNPVNYWVNMQDCSNGVKNLTYDLGDCTRWEYMFPTNDKPILKVPDEDEIMFNDDDEEEEIEKHLDMPPSWVKQIQITARDFEMHCPQGKKTKYYKRAKLEKFAPYLLKDGISSRLSVYSDTKYTQLLEVTEYYSNRKDKLMQKTRDLTTGWVTEYFAPGRHKHLKEYKYNANAPMWEPDRVMTFYNKARVDGLMKRVETPTEMTEHYTDRGDFLYYKYMQYGKTPKKFGPAEGPVARQVLQMIERYRRNKAKHANDDVAERAFLCSEDRMTLVYHDEDVKITVSTREFIKPANAHEKGATILWQPENHTTYQVNRHLAPKKKVDLYELLLKLLADEDVCRENGRDSEDEVQEILNERMREEVASELTISVYDTERNESAKQHRSEIEKLQQQQSLRRQEAQLDYLAPFLAQIGDPVHVTLKQAFKLKDDCLADLKQRLIDKANLIQARFEKESQELQKKQAWYQQNQVNMQKDDEDEYLNYCSDAMFRIHILELRLNRHKEMAPQKYMELEQRIRGDARLVEYF